MARLTANSSDAYPQTRRRRSAISRLRVSLCLKRLSVAESMGWPESVKECRRCVANAFGLVGGRLSAISYRLSAFGFRLRQKQRQILTPMKADFADSLGAYAYADSGVVVRGFP
jgi:hypothetical protein